MDMIATRDDTLLGTLRHAYRSATRSYRTQLSHLDLTARQAAAILVVSAHPGIGLASVAESIGADQPTTSALIDRLVERGLLLRRPDPSDRRRACLFLAPAADGLAAEIHAARGATEQLLLSLLGDERAAMLQSLLADLSNRLDAVGQGSA